MTTISIVTLVQVFLLVIALILALMAAVAWSRRRRTSEAIILSLLLASAAIYCFGYAGEVAQTSLAGAMFWIHVEFLGIPWIPFLLVSLIREHNHLPSRDGLLAIIPLITFVAQENTSGIPFFERSMWMTLRDPFWVVSVDRGPIAWLFLAYTYAALLYGAWIYIFKLRTSSHLFRKQSLLFITSFLPPLAGNFIYLCGWSPWGLDLAPVMMSITIIMGYIAVFRLEFFDLVPMARSLVFNNMRDAALVTDMQYLLVDFNPAARELFPALSRDYLGNNILTAFPKEFSLREVFNDPEHKRKIDLRLDNEHQHFEARVFPLLIEKHQAGWAVILANITSQVHLVHELRREAETDKLTGVANRRCFTTAIEHENARSVRYGSIFSLLVIDIDHFKGINDRFGHLVGDCVLATVTSRIVSCLRHSDLPCRYGGDEFAILLPETGAKSAREVAERIRRAIASTPVEMDDRSIAVSACVGVSTYDPSHAADWMRLLEEADQALYCAKAGGRNKSMSFPVNPA